MHVSSPMVRGRLDHRLVVACTLVRVVTVGLQRCIGGLHDRFVGEIEAALCTRLGNSCVAGDASIRRAMLALSG